MRKRERANVWNMASMSKAVSSLSNELLIRGNLLRHKNRSAQQSWQQLFTPTKKGKQKIVDCVCVFAAAAAVGHDGKSFLTNKGSEQTVLVCRRRLRRRRKKMTCRFLFMLLTKCCRGKKEEKVRLSNCSLMIAKWKVPSALIYFLRDSSECPPLMTIKSTKFTDIIKIIINRGSKK